MAVDGLILHQEIKTLQDIIPAKINRITQPSDSEILFAIRANFKNQQLLLCAHSQYNRINLTKLNYTNPSTPSSFVMLLRKHLENGIITEINQGGLDRYLKITIVHRNEISDEETHFLYLELMGKYANLILCDKDNIILDALKRIPPYQNTKRIIFAGALYQPNPLIEKADPFTINNVDIETPLSQQLAGFSPLLGKEVEYRLTKNQKYPEIMKMISDSKDIYYYPVEKVYHILPLTHLNSDYHIYEINEGFDLIYQDVQERLRIEQLTGNLFKFVRSELKKRTNKLPKLQESLNIAYDCDKWRKYGDLIFSNLAMVKKGLKNIELFDYETEENITVVLDERLDGKENGKKCYQKYQKSRNAQKHLTEQVKICEEEIAFFTTILEQLEIADFLSAQEIKDELIIKGYLRKKLKKSKQVKLNYQTLEVDGALVYLGKNNSQNDYVTFKLAHKSDMWFHTKDYHGAHVIIKTSTPNEKQIRFCANLAAYYSKGRFSSTVPVNYTLVKNIKKIPNSPLGLVSISEYKTIYIDPEKPL